MTIDYITPDIVDKCIEIVKKGDYNFDKFVMPVAENAPCTVTQALFPMILDMALQTLKRQARVKPLETFIELPELKRSPKNRDKEIVPIPIFVDRKDQFS